MAEQEAKYDSGIFLLQEETSFNRTILGLNVSGYCTVNKKTNDHSFYLFLTLYRGQRRREVELEADCEYNDTNSNDSVTICSVQSQKEIKVQADQSIGIIFNSRCSGNNANRCTCRPATVDTGTQLYQFMNTSDTSNKSLASYQFVENVGLQLSFTIQRGETGYAPRLYMHSPNPQCILLVVYFLYGTYG